MEGVSRRAPGETNPASTLTLDFWPGELWANTFLLFEGASLWPCVMQPRKLAPGSWQRC